MRGTVDPARALRCVEAGQLLGIPTLDHALGYHAMREQHRAWSEKPSPRRDSTKEPPFYLSVSVCGMPDIKKSFQIHYLCPTSGIMSNTAEAATSYFPP